MSLSPPATHAEHRLKYACEECHSRKIRCYALPNTQPGTCTPCHVNGRKCLFALKNKTGRPRRMTPQHSKSKPNNTTVQEWEQSSIEWERRTNLLRHRPEHMGYANDDAETYTDIDDRLSLLTGRPTGFSSRIPITSMASYEGSTAQTIERQHDSPGMLDYDIDCMQGTDFPNLFAIGSLSNTSSGSSSDLMSRDYLGMSLMPSALDSTSLSSKTISSELCNTARSSYSDLTGDTTYDQAFNTSQQLHRRFLEIQSQAFDLPNKYASAELCQALESFDILAKLLKQRIAGHKEHPHSGGLPAMIVSGSLYVAVLQAVLLATVLLQSDGEASNTSKNANNTQMPNATLQHGQQYSAVDDLSVHSCHGTPQNIGNLECILNLTKMEYYITVFNQYLQLFFCVNNADHGAQGPSPVFDYKSCIDTTESIQSRVRLLLSQSRESML
jgi:hypothetical protein